MDTRLLGSGAAGVAKTAIFTHAGLDPAKQVNEDVAVSIETPVGLLAVVCDGMGGHEGGKIAAETAVAEIVRALSATHVGDNPKHALAEAIRSANTNVYALSTGKTQRAGATCVAILVHAQGTEVAHVGDSRAHLSHRGTIAVLTRDHSKVRAMMDAGLLTPEEARYHPDANQITRALGIAENVDVELREAPVPHQIGDVFILCSDGLTDLVSPEEVLDHTSHLDETRAAEALVGVALSRGGHDNATIVIVHLLVDAVVASTRTAYLTPPPAPSSKRGTESARAIPVAIEPPPSSTRATPTSPTTATTTATTTERPAPISQGSELAAGATAPPILAIAPNPGNLPGRETLTTAEPQKRSRASLWIGLSLALFAIAILVSLYFVIEQKQTRVSVPVGPFPLAPATPSTRASQ